MQVCGALTGETEIEPGDQFTSSTARSRQTKRLGG